MQARTSGARGSSFQGELRIIAIITTVIIRVIIMARIITIVSNNGTCSSGDGLALCPAELASARSIDARRPSVLLRLKDGSCVKQLSP